ncbi:hypothetical protein [Nocardiopsis dassonvillei]|uniref:hypothetical protein n=1 Tax=Nocardiopsis dassonvillei TaxID=2014 RepID=UPI003670CBAF
MVAPGVCSYCERRIGSQKNGNRKKHYINERAEWFGYKLKECKGSSPERGSRPLFATIEEWKKRRSGKMKCLACQQWVGFTKAFLPVKHPDERGRTCRGWSDNQQRP